MKTPLFLLFAISALPITAEARNLFNEPVHLGNGDTSQNGQAVHGSVPRSTPTVVKKPKTTVVPYDAEQVADTQPAPTTTTAGTTVTTDAYAPPPPEPTAAPTPTAPSTPTEPVATTTPAPNTPSEPVNVTPTEPATPVTPPAANTIVVTEPAQPTPTEPVAAVPTPTVQETAPVTTPAPTVVTPTEPTTPIAIERAAPPPAVQLPAGGTQTAEPVKTTADNSGYADKMFDAIKSMLGQKTQPLDDSLIRDEK